MKVIITAHCTFCARKFNAIQDSESYDSRVDRVVCDDMNGKLCCVECLCGYCGRGHATAEDYETCANESYVDDDWNDLDVFRDSVYDVHAGVI